MKLITRSLVAIVLVPFASALFAAPGSPDALVKSTVDDVLAVIKQTRDRQKLRELAEQKVLPHFDFKEMTRLAVGPAWRQANAQQQQALEKNFRTLLVNTYTASLSRNAGNSKTVEVKPAQTPANQNDVTVKTLVKEPGGQPIAIDYRMAKSGDGWKVYDVVVENVSLVTTYRAEFSEAVKRSGIDGLIKALDEKNHRVAQG